MRSMFFSLQSFPHFSPFPIYNFLVKLTTTDQTTTSTPKTIPGRPSFTSITIYHQITTGIAYKQQRRSKKVYNIRDTELPEKGKMSWQTYVDEHLMCDIDGNGQHLAAAAIVGHDGSPWAKSASFPQFKAEEITAIMKDFDEPGHLAPTGLHLGGVKYMVIAGEAGAVIRGKKGSGGITIKKTGQALVFGIYEEPVTPGQCNMVVERLGDYLADQGL